ncbi:MAG: hypothetical protein AAF317_11830 [Pseudomonadota bacterium]
MILARLQTGQIRPAEAALRRFRKPGLRPFTGRDAILTQETSSPWQSVLLAIDHGLFDPFHSQNIFAGDHPVGVITSVGYGLGAALPGGIAHLRPGPSDDGLPLQILDETRAARVCPAPPRDLGSTRMPA